MPVAPILWLIAAVMAAVLGGCDLFTDAATRIAYDLEANVGRLPDREGSVYVVRHATPSKAGECEGPYRVQFDKVGALIIWCKDSEGRTVSSHSTTYHNRFVESRETFILDKPAGSTLLIYLERRNGRAVIARVL